MRGHPTVKRGACFRFEARIRAHLDGRHRWAAEGNPYAAAATSRSSLWSRCAV